MNNNLRALGNSGIKISPIGVGCWVMGGDWFGGGPQDDDSIKAIRHALSAGVNFIDTAELYGDGHSEEVVGRALSGHLRESVVISSKVWKSHMHYGDVQRACEESLRRMGLDYIDLYFVHYPPEICSIEETMEAMANLKKSGKIRAIGLSNFNVAQMERAAKVAAIDVVQPCHSLFWRFAEQTVIRWCKENQVGVVTYSPLAQGLLTGKYTPNWHFAEDDKRRNAPLFQGNNYTRALNAVEKLRPFAEKYRCSLAQLAIAWAIAVPGITSAIVGARNERQMSENLGGISFSLEEDDWKAIDQIGRTVTDPLLPYKTFFSVELEADTDPKQ